MERSKKKAAICMGKAEKRPFCRCISVSNCSYSRGTICGRRCRGTVSPFSPPFPHSRTSCCVASCLLCCPYPGANHRGNWNCTECWANAAVHAAHICTTHRHEPPLPLSCTKRQKTYVEACSCYSSSSTQAIKLETGVPSWWAVSLAMPTQTLFCSFFLAKKKLPKTMEMNSTITTNIR